MKKVTVFLIGICALFLTNLNAALTLDLEPTSTTVVSGFVETMIQKFRYI